MAGWGQRCRFFHSSGYGVFIDDWNGKKLINHSGSDIGYSTYIGMVPQDSVAVVFMSNLHRFVPYDVIANAALCTVYNKPISKLKKPINLVIAPILCKEGFAKAREKYFNLKKDSQLLMILMKTGLIRSGFALLLYKSSTMPFIFYR